jgi:3-keto-disaccharide hydrolase
MKKSTLAVCSLVTAFLFAVAPSATAKSNPSPSGDPFIGAYDGAYHATGRPDNPASASVVSQGRGVYRLDVRYQTGPTLAEFGQVELYGIAQGPKLNLTGYAGNISWTGSVENGTLRLLRSDPHYGGRFALTKIVHISPTEGAKPPRNAVVLLPFEPGKKTTGDQWTNPKWELLDDGSMQVQGRSGDNRTKESFGSIRLHLEFNLAHMPGESGQGRSNSGVYFQDRYEVQVLDSFGLISGSGDCGGIYEQSAPRVNACYPPGQWQTYDITFRAAEFDRSGAIKKFPTLTVKLNGVVVQEDHVFKTVTGGAVSDKVVDKARLRLQDHGDPVRYRNIWVVELD